ncbi:hypothetical protein H0H92_000074 [Tricholoma furcatifolium]|nr:hypothetical protein H0H92_000074 [Tricholoma furcatifolium]
MFNGRFAQRSAHSNRLKTDVRSIPQLSSLPFPQQHPLQNYKDEYFDDYSESIGEYMRSLSLETSSEHSLDMQSSPSPPERSTQLTYSVSYEPDEIDEYDAYTLNNAAPYQQMNQTVFYDNCSSFRTPVSLNDDPYSGQDLKLKISSSHPNSNFDQLHDSQPGARSLELSTTNHDSGYIQSPIASQSFKPRNAYGIALMPVSVLHYAIKREYAPTGSGKTVLFELAIIRMLSLPDNSERSLKCVYMAPTKALCSERYRDWTEKFDPLGIKCAELTGDTVHFGKGVWGDAKKASIIITTVHILNEARGSTLEVVVSRMKTRGSFVRFFFVSATVPNIHDIAAWIGRNGQPHVPAKVFAFGEEFRPCKLTRFVIGVPRSKGQNDFAFNRSLDFKLFAVLQQYSTGKPIMDKRLTDLASIGIGIHHAGLSLDDRKATETLYLNGTLRVIVATSTLAVGVNLPAHMVVIKGVQTYQNNTSVEYSDLDIMQMLGRAGRPQFDKDGIALIMCEADLEQKYRSLVQGKTILESTLHTNLAEHLNSEIGLGTITSISTAKEWLRGSFLCQRLQKNPRHYSLDENARPWEDRVDDLVMQSVERLRQTQLIETPADGARGAELVSTDFGDIMSKLETIASSEEFSDIKLRASEKMALNKLLKHQDIRFEIKKLEKTADKVLLLIQAVLAGISLNAPEYKSADSQPQLEAFRIFRHVSRIARAIVEVGVCKQLGAQVKHGLELLRCLTAKAWEDRPIVLRQLEQIGEKSNKVLAEHGIVSISHLLQQDSLRIETLLNRRSPFGLELLTSARELPRYTLSISELDVTSSGGGNPVEVELSVHCGLVKTGNTQPSKPKKRRGYHGDMTVVLTVSSDLELIDYRRISTKSLEGTKAFTVTAELTRPSQSITVLISSETIAGVVVTQSYKPALSPENFPTRDTRPPTTIDIDLAGLEDDPDFWNMEEEEEVTLVVRDLTKSGKDQSKYVAPHKCGTEGPDRDGILPRILHNGNIECNHPCKDKVKCRHLCCKEGLLPEKPKNRPSSAKYQMEPSRPSAEVKTITGNTKAKPKTSTCKRMDRRLEQLESLHDRSSVNRNLHISPGRRLKLDSAVTLKKKRKAVPDFEIEYAELKTPHDTMSKSHEWPESDDDDLPEAPGISFARQLQRPSSETDCSDSDLDSLIRAVPLDLEDQVQGRSPSFAQSPLKRKRAIELTTSNKKMQRSPQKLTHMLGKTVNFYEPPQHAGSKGAAEPLFLPSDDSKAKEPSYEPSRVNIPQETVLRNEFPFPTEYQDPGTSTLEQTTSTISHARADEEDKCADDFAELDAWLNSGAVEIL